MDKLRAMTRAAPLIVQIDLLLTSMPFSAERRVLRSESVDEYNASSSAFTQMEALMVKVRDAEGRVGWGEAFGHKSNPASWAALEEIVGPFAVGRSSDPTEFRGAAEYAFHAFGRTGPIHFALSAVDTALWDLKAQRHGVALRHLVADALETTAAEAVTCYASLVHYGEDPIEVAHHIERAQNAGFDAFKLHESTAAAVSAARDQAGPSAALMTDVNCHWNETDANRAVQELAPLDLIWLEEPIFPPDDTPALARLNKGPVPIAAGENASGSQGMIQQIQAGAVTFAQPSVGKIGGVSAMLDVIRAGRGAGVRIAPHCFYYGPALNAVAEIVAALGSKVHLEAPFLTWPQRLHPLHGAGPDIYLSSSPGLGFEPDPAILAEHLTRSTTIS